MGVDVQEPEWLRTARRNGLIVSEGSPVGLPDREGYSASRPRKPTTKATMTEIVMDSPDNSQRTATATPDPTPPPPRKPPQKGYDVLQHTSPPPAPWAVEFTVDYSPRNESNIGGGLRAKLGRKAEAKRLTDAAIPPALGLMPLPVLVTLTRVGGMKRMDDDGLATSLKFVRDRVAAALGVDDGDTRKVRFRTRQRAGYGRARVLVRVEGRRC